MTAPVTPVDDVFHVVYGEVRRVVPNGDEMGRLRAAGCDGRAESAGGGSRGHRTGTAGKGWSRPQVTYLKDLLARPQICCHHEEGNRGLTSYQPERGAVGCAGSIPPVAHTLNEMTIREQRVQWGLRGIEYQRSGTELLNERVATSIR